MKLGVTDMTGVSGTRLIADRAAIRLGISTNLLIDLRALSRRLFPGICVLGSSVWALYTLQAVGQVAIPNFSHGVTFPVTVIVNTLGCRRLRDK
ncbi:hypothetical protein F4776DRAFT_497277 [Hypoxylon sp. NC0597]|nr:hypothetical protein F4776DRAFT_497277 [Hypoxylon sp. NC0597]